MSDVAGRIEQLREELRQHDRLYYVEAAPKISDREYDRLMDELKTLEQANPIFITPDSPTQRVSGEPLEGFRTVQHAQPMLSIENTYSREELLEFDARVRRTLGEGAKYTYMVDPKIDGVAASLRYLGKMLVTVTTRGDGLRGDDITSNARTIKSIPLNLGKRDLPDVLEIRGEIYWPRSAFEEYNRNREAKGIEPLANPRNGTAGTLKQLDPRIVAERKLAFLAHGFGEMSQPPAATAGELADLLRVCGMPVDSHRHICNNIEEVWQVIEQWRIMRGDVDYDTDGMVVKVNELGLRQQLGTTRKYPRWCIAYKYETDRARTKLKSVDFQVGRTGQITPVARFDPVPLGGTRVSNASLHNFDEIERLDVHMGDTIHIEKAGEIIPQVVDVAAAERAYNAPKITPPTNCPACDSVLEWDMPNPGNIAFRCENKECKEYLKRRQASRLPEHCRKRPTKQNPNGVGCDSPVFPVDHMTELRCHNPECPAQLRELLIYFTGRKQMNIQNMGPAVIDKLIEAKLVRDIPSIFAITEKDLMRLDGIQEKGATRILDSINEAKNRGMVKLLASLGIDAVGEFAASLLCKHSITKKTKNAEPEIVDVGFLDLESVANASFEDLTKCFQNAAGPKTPENIFKFINSEYGRDLIHKKKLIEPFITEQVIPKVGEITAMQLRENFETWDNLLNATQDDIHQALGIKSELGNTITKNIYEYFHSEKGINLIQKLKEYGVKLSVNIVENNTPQTLEGKTVVVTGSLENFSRQQAQDAIKAAGGRATSSVSASTSFVVAGENPGSKVDDATALGVEIIDEQEFIKRLELQDFLPEKQAEKDSNKSPDNPGPLFA